MFTNVGGASDLAVNTVHIKIEIPEQFRDNSKYYYFFIWLDGDEVLKKITVTNKGEQREASHKIDFDHHKKLSSLKAWIKIEYRKWWMFNDTVQTFETNLFGFKNGEIIKKNFKYEDKKFFVSWWMDIPIGDEKRNLEEVKITEIVYTAPPFKVKASTMVEESEEESDEEIKDKKSSVKKSPTKKKTVVKKTVEIPEGVMADEIKDPDVQRNLWSLLYCQKQSEKYENIVNAAIKNSQKIDDNIKTKLLLFQSQAIGIQNAIENKQTDFDTYIGYLKKGLEHDNLLLQYFEDSGNETNAKIVRFRIEWYEKEINGEAEED